MTQLLTPPGPIHFEDCVFEVAARRLLRAGQLVDLEPKMYELLEILIARQPAVVTNEELDELLWPKVYVARTSLTRLVSELRALLGDNAREARFIRTVYKRGYAFCATLRSGAAAPLQSDIRLLWREQQLPVGEGAHVLGRGAECNLVIDAATVSRRHARICVTQGNVSIEDLGSKNGTHIDDIEIQGTVFLKDGCKIALGSEPMTLKKRNPTAETVAADRNPANLLKKVRGLADT